MNPQDLVSVRFKDKWYKMWFHDYCDNGTILVRNKYGVLIVVRDGDWGLLW